MDWIYLLHLDGYGVSRISKTDYKKRKNSYSFALDAGLERKRLVTGSTCCMKSGFYSRGINPDNPNYKVIDASEAFRVLDKRDVDLKTIQQFIL